MPENPSTFSLFSILAAFAISAIRAINCGMWHLLMVQPSTKAAALSPFHIIHLTDAAIPSSLRSSSPPVSITTTLKTNSLLVGSAALQRVWLPRHLTNLISACSFLSPTTTTFDGHSRWLCWLIWHAGCSVASPINVSGATCFSITIVFRI